MIGRIGTWHRRYRVFGSADHRQADALADGPVLAAYEDALRQALGSETSLILVREVHASFALNLAAEARPPAETWGRAMAAAVVRTIANDAGGGNVIRFADEAAHLAAFIVEVAEGRPGDDWYFERFAACRRHDPADTLRTLLFENSVMAAAVLRRLAERNRLAGILQMIGPAATAWLWSTCGAIEPAATPDADRPLFAAALRLLEQIAGGKVDRERAERFFSSFLETRSAPTDWRDPGSLADVVAAAVRFLAAKLAIAWRPDGHRVERATTDLQWLDIPRLTQALQVGDDAPPISLTSRQRCWRDAIVEFAPRIADHLDRSHPNSPANALLLLSELTARHPEWADDPALPGFVNAVLVVPQLAIRELQLAEPCVRTAAAGVFLLLRTMHELRLPALALKFSCPVPGPVGSRRFVAALAARWSGLPLEAEPGLLAFAGIESADEAASLRSGWSDTAKSLQHIQEATAGITECGSEDISIIRTDATGDEQADAVLDAIAASAVRAWARWLKHIGHSTTPYLLNQLIRRSGRLIRRGDELVVELEPRPLDPVLRLSGDLDDYDLPPGGPLRVIRFRIAEAV